MNAIYMKRICLTTLLAAGTLLSFAQTRTGYFMRNTPQRYSINPAQAPEKGYLGLPVISGLNFEYNSNSSLFTAEQLIYKDAATGNKYLFYNAPASTGFSSAEFLNSIEDNNKISTNFGLNILNVGFWTKVGFFSLDLNLKSSMNISVSKGLFAFMLDGMNANGTPTSYNFGMRSTSASYIETALGYSRPINEEWSVGGKLKFYNGLVASDINYDKINATLSGDKWQITTDGTVDVAMSGAKFEVDEDGTVNSNGDYPIDGLDNDGFKPSGFGMGVDLGVEYKPKAVEDLTLSFAVNDLGFINWSKSNVISADSKGTFTHDGFENILDNNNSKSVKDQISDMGDDLKEVFMPYEAESRSMSTGLTTKIHLGGEYDFFQKQLTVGLLSSTYVNDIRTIQEITTAATYTPIKWFSLAASYSWVNSGFKTMGWALSLNPNSGARVFLASDYMIGKINPQGIPISGKNMNLSMGISFLLGGNKNNIEAFNF
ncbi:MAG: DUF5723 family protein [Bacteroidales bacterium]|nr:DUF5723 family protein [Bacteroidales bacterium]